MVTQTPNSGKQKQHGHETGEILRIYLDGTTTVLRDEEWHIVHYDISECEMADEVLRLVEQDDAAKCYPEPNTLRAIEKLKLCGQNPDWFAGFMAAFHAPLPKVDANRTARLGPYLSTRAVTDEQVDECLGNGLGIDEIHDRLLQAECTIVTSFSADAWRSGWMTACNAIEWLGGPNNDPDNGLIWDDLLEFAEQRYQSERCICYTRHLNGMEWTGTDSLSDASGRLDCIKSSDLLMPEEFDETDFSEVASILREHPDPQEIKAVAARQQALTSHQMLNRAVWTPYGYVSTDILRSL